MGSLTDKYQQLRKETAVNIFEGEYGIKVTINGKSKP